MNCPNCNKPVQGTEKFCRYCGFPLKANGSQDSVQPKTEQLHNRSIESDFDPAGIDAPQAELNGDTSLYSAHNETQQIPYQPETHPEATMPETMPGAQPEAMSGAQPPKKSKLPVIIIISVAAAAVIAAGVFFAIWFFGGKNSGNKDTASSSASSSAAQTATDSQPGQENAQFSERIANLEKALNDNDEQAMADQFVPELRNQKIGESNIFKNINEFIDQTGQTITYKLELSDNVKIDGDTASGTIKIAASIPIIGDQSGNAKVTFKKVDGKWYIKEIK